MQTQLIEVNGMRFDAAVAGTPGDPLVLLLHGFPQSHYAWREQLPALAAAGFLAVAPNQRGYSPTARPLDIVAYAMELLVSDALAIATAFGAERFHLVGHDWGGQLAWLTAAHFAERVSSLSVLSRPHPAAFRSALRSDRAQSTRSRHHSAFDAADSADRLLADGARRLRRMFAEQGVDARDIDAYLETLGTRDALDAALNWYRAAGASEARMLGAAVPAVTQPTLYVWGELDATVGRAAAELTAEHVRGPYHFEVIAGAGHFLTDQVGAAVTRALLTHLRR